MKTVAFLDVAVRFFQRAVAHFAQVKQALKPIIERDESAEINHIGDGSLDEHAFVVPFQGVVPGVGQQALATERDAVGVAIETEHVDIDLFADL